MLGDKVSFVLKLDECQIVKGKRLERILITLMNEAMEYAKEENCQSLIDVPSFSVQSEKEVLAWAFERISWITNTMKAQIQGHKLEVEGKGSFTVD